MFNPFKKSSPKAPSHRDIVYDFAEILGQLRLPIKDARLLPHPKSTIFAAFMHYEAELVLMAKFDSGSREELEMVQRVGMHIGDFQVIDREDIGIVMEINSGPRFKRFREKRFGRGEILSPDEEEALQIFTEYMTKYLGRGVEETWRQRG